MKRLIHIMIGALLFLAGGVADHWWMKRAVTASPQESPSPRESVQTADKEAAAGSIQTAGQKSGSPANTRQADALASSQAAAQPRAAASEETALDDDDEVESEQVLTPLHLLEPLTTQTNADGSKDEFGKTEDGKDGYRHYNPSGSLTREGWSTDKGETFYRGYYETGGVKQVTWNRPDTSSLSINLTQSGLFEGKYERAADGTGLSTEYDDAGNPKETWRIGADGAAARAE